MSRIRQVVSSCLTAALLAALAVFATATPAQAAVYSGNLCSAGDDRVIISFPTSWGYDRIHATSDFTANSNGFSFRTCSWRGTNHVYKYRCTNEATNGWQIHLVARENNTARRDYWNVTCDNTFRTIKWSKSHSTHEAVHFHLWAPPVNSWEDHTDCGESCPRYLYGWSASVS